MLVLLAGFGLGTSSARAQAYAMFPTKTGAEQRAKELKCSGVFAMGKDWMPCQSIEAYQKAVPKEK